MKVSVIIVNYNSGRLLLDCVESIHKSRPPFDVEIVVVDNASKDDSIAVLERESFANVELIKSRNNLGFSAANNLGAAKAGGDVLFFLNPDTKLLSGAIWSEFSRIDDRHIYTTRLVGLDGVEYSNINAIPTVKNYLARMLARPYKVWAQGSVVIMCRQVFEKLGRWPEDYFMYSEDLDLFYNAALQDIYVKVLDVSVMHIGGGTTENVWSTSERQKRVERSYRRFSRKYKLLFDYHMLHAANFFRNVFRDPAKAWFVYSIYLKSLGTKF